MTHTPTQARATHTVYLATGAADAETAAGARRRLIDTAHAGRHLREFGYRVVLVREGSTPSKEASSPDQRPSPLDRRPRVDTLPSDPGAWLVTADVDTCLLARRTGRLRTVLVGPRSPGESGLGRPADLQARSLLDAVLTIVAAESTPG